MNRPHAQPSTDDFVERIVREVIRRLLAMEAEPRGQRTTASVSNGFTPPAVSPPHAINEKLITAATLETIPLGTKELLIPSRAVVTPLARDEAKSKGVRLIKVEPSKHSSAGASR